MANLLSFIILIFFFWGRSLRFKNLRLHIQVMCAVMIADLALVAGLVVMRDALGKVGGGMPWTLQIHVPIAVTTVALYFFTAWTGYQLLRGFPVRKRMREFDRLLVTFRVLTLVTSLMVQFIKA